MAKQEHDREDLMREATGLRPRAELSLGIFAENVVFGFRASGGLSLYFGPDPVYQFNSNGELRRAYENGSLFKAVKGQLKKLQRERNEKQVTLWQSDLNKDEVSDFLFRMRSNCDQLLNALDFQVKLVEEVPPSSNSLELLRRFLSKIENPPRIAEQPNSI